MNEASQRPRIKKNMVAVLVAASIVYPSQTSADIPVSDFSQIAQIVQQTAQQARQFAQQMQAFTNGIKNETDTSAQIDIVNQMILAKVNAIVI
ncbi:hypothetical protein ACWTQY_29495, partial [Klebsiella pneumoniae]